MKVCVILNPTAGGAHDRASLAESASRLGDVKIWETSFPGDAKSKASKAAAEGYGLVVAAGGDGTINEVANGLMAAIEKARLGIVPLGTGNDLARTLAIPSSASEALEWAREGRARSIDLIHVRFGAGGGLYGVNAASGGLSGQVDRVVTADLKKTLGPLAFLYGTAVALKELDPFLTLLRCDGDEVERVESLGVIIANGRTIGGGYEIASRANPEDGWLDVVLIRYRSTLDLAEVAAGILSGAPEESDVVAYRRARFIEVQSHPAMTFNVDGELLDTKPISFTIEPQVLQVVVGPEYAPDPFRREHGAAEP